MRPGFANGARYPSRLPDGIFSRLAYSRAWKNGNSEGSASTVHRKHAEPIGVAKNGAIQRPWAEYGFTGATRISFSSLSFVIVVPHSAAAQIATAPPRDVPSRSKDEIPSLSRKCRTRSAVARIE